MSAQHIPEPYDFRRPTTLPREHARVLTEQFDGFARQVATQLSNRFGSRKITATAEGLRINTYTRWTAALPSGTVMTLIEFGDLESHAVFSMPNATAMNWISQLIGGQPVELGTVAARKFSATDVALIQDLVHGFLEDLSYSFAHLIDPAVGVKRTVFNPQMAQAAKPNDLMICVELNFDDGHTLSLAVPAAEILPRMGTATPVSTDEEMRIGLQENIGAVPVEVSLQIASRQILASEVLKWEEGTEILFPHPKQHPLTVMVGSKPVAKALRASRGLNAAMKITTNEEGK